MTRAPNTSKQHLKVAGQQVGQARGPRERRFGCRVADRQKEEAGRKAATIEFIDADNVQTSETSALDFRSTTREGTPTRKRNASLRFCYDYRADSDFLAGFAGGELAKANGCAVCASVDLGDMIGPFLRGDDFAAGNFFLGDKKIRFESGSTDVRTGAMLADGPSKESNAPSKDSKSGGATAMPTPSTLEGPFPSAAEMKTTNIVRDVFIGGELYRLFTEPIYVSSQEQPWFLGFLMQRHDFDDQVKALSYGSLSYLLLLLPILILAAPLLKIRTMGRRERLKAMDVRVLTFSLIALAGAVTTLGLAVYDYTRLGTALDEELVSVSKQLRDHLADELTHATRALGVFVTQYARDRVLHPDYAVSPPVKPGIFNDSKDPVASSLRTIYPFFNMVVWSDRNAQQMGKWSVGDTVTPLTKNPNTSSYTDIKEGRLRELDAGNAEKTHVSFQLRFSPNTGKLIPVISMPIERSAAGDQRRRRRSSLAARRSSPSCPS